ncbi:MAG: DNA polymerase III subunit gamma/tau [Clostridia bacterium]|nr:DNA polymerase III subunit gamma/tau [Clostridia bacterium]
MAYLALYRKYRPSTFDGLIGQEHIVKTLVNQIESQRLGHAYLFTGTRGTGKTSAAKIFAKAINCLTPINGSPCGKCEACKALADPSNIDVIEIDAASNNGVNEIRELREKVQYPPVSVRYKVYIVDEVHMLTGAAFNALLKTLEEPPKHAVFILATTEVHKIPATILSRCMRFDFRLISVEKIAKLIAEIYDEQGKKYDKEAVFAIAKAGEGSIRDALSIADIAISYGTGKLKYDDVMEILGSSNTELLLEFISYLLGGKSGQVLSVIDSLVSMGKSMGILTKDVTAIVRDLLVIKTCDNANSILGLPEDRFDVYKQIADSTNEERLLRVLQIFAEAETSLKYTNHPRVVFETAAIKATRPDADYDINALLSRIKTLEEKLEKGVPVAYQMAEKVIEKKPIEPIKIEQKEKINSVTAEELKGKLLLNLRKIGSEMLWNVVQNVKLEVKANTLFLTCQSQTDVELLQGQNSMARIKEALVEFEDFDITVNLSSEEKMLDEVDQATERLKKIFGDDIVVIK